jgi:hypothetical protein
MTNGAPAGQTESSSSVSVPSKPIKRKKTVIDGIIESESETQTVVEVQDPQTVDAESLPI